MGRLTVLIEEADRGELLILSEETVLDAIGVVGFAEEEAASLRR